MATNYNCEACEELRQDAPSLICNGFDDEMCASLQNNTGLSPSSGNDDCEDLNNLNDCLVGNMESEVDMYEVCDWKSFMKKFIPNLWTVLKAIICAICGLWNNIKCVDTTINVFDAINTFAEVSDYRYFYDWQNVNTASNPASPATVSYAFMHSYVLARPGTQVAALLNEVSVGQYGNHVVDGVSYSGIPVYQFTGNIKDANFDAFMASTHVDGLGRFTYGTAVTAQNGDEMTITVIIRSKLREVTIHTDESVSFQWNDLVRRHLYYGC